jgi:Uma2 family endonuclease
VGERHVDRRAKVADASQYLEQERRADFKSEYLAGEAFARADASRAHNLIVGNTVREAGNQLRNGACEVYPSDMRVLIPTTGLYTYPDVVIACGTPEFGDEVNDTLLNPTVLFEVLSESTEAWDRGRKSTRYRSIPSLQEYVLLSQTEPSAELYRRRTDGTWILTDVTGLESIVALTSVGVSLPLSEIYARIEFPAPGRESAASSSAR